MGVLEWENKFMVMFWDKNNNQRYIAHDNHFYYDTNQIELAKTFTTKEKAENEFRMLRRRGYINVYKATILKVNVEPVSTIEVYN